MADAMNKSGDVLCFIDEILFKAEGTVPLCPAYEATIKSLFDYNYRHTNNVPVFKEDSIKKPVVKFSSDTIIISDLLFHAGKYELKPGIKKSTGQPYCTSSCKKVFKDGGQRAYR